MGRFNTKIYRNGVEIMTKKFLPETMSSLITNITTFIMRKSDNKLCNQPPNNNKDNVERCVVVGLVCRSYLSGLSHTLLQVRIFLRQRIDFLFCFL